MSEFSNDGVCRDHFPKAIPNPTTADYTQTLTTFPERSKLDNDFYWNELAKWFGENDAVIRSALTFAANQTRYVTDEDREIIGKSLERIKMLITAAEGK